MKPAIFLMYLCTIVITYGSWNLKTPEVGEKRQNKDITQTECIVTKAQNVGTGVLH
jgi:hypothetical protein